MNWTRLIIFAMVVNEVVAVVFHDLELTCFRFNLWLFSTYVPANMCRLKSEWFNLGIPILLVLLFS